MSDRQRFGWAGEPGRSPLRINNSTFSVIAACTTQAMLKWYGWTSAEETAAMLAGTAAHAGLAAHLDGQPRDSALAEFDKLYQHSDAAMAQPGDSRLTWRNTRTILSAWLDAHQPAALPFTVKHTEIDFEVPLDEAGDFVLTGRLDGIGELRETGDLVVLEHKTTGMLTPWWASQFRLSSQVSGYVFAARQHLRGEAVVGAIVNALEFSRLPSDPARKCKTHSVAYAECGPLHAKWQMIGPIQRSAAQLAMWRQTALAQARRWRDLLLANPDLEGVAALQAEGQFNGACRGCPAADWCEQGRDPALLPQLMQRADAATEAVP